MPKPIVGNSICCITTLALLIATSSAAAQDSAGDDQQPDVILRVGKGFDALDAIGVEEALKQRGCTVAFSEGGFPGRLTLEATSDGFKRRYADDATGAAVASFSNYCQN